jgi:hypothetical protein
LSDVLASAESGRLYRIEVFLQADGPAAAARPSDTVRYILRTSEGERVLRLDCNRYRLKSGEVLTALAPASSEC